MRQYFEQLCEIVVGESPELNVEFTAKITTDTDYFEDGGLDYEIEGIRDINTCDDYKFEELCKEKRLLIESEIETYMEDNYDEITHFSNEVI